jgi:hypothetical protein
MELPLAGSLDNNNEHTHKGHPAPNTYQSKEKTK